MEHGNVKNAAVHAYLLHGRAGKQITIISRVSYMLDYSPMWEYMKTHNYSQYYLLKHDIDSKTIFKLRRNENITLLTLEKLCRAMNCTPNDIVKFVD